MGWTERQEQAIYYSEDKDLLVAAAAGSGKTSVMVERVIDLVLNKGIDIDEVLVVTFTNAAAASMKDKIAKRLRDSGSKDQLRKLPEASISTFDSLAQRLVRDNFQIIDIDPGAKILDDAQTVLIKNQALDELFDRKLAEAEPDFVAFLDAYSDIKSLESIRETIDKLYDKLMALPDPLEKLDEAAEVNFKDEEEFLKSEAGRFYVKELKRLARKAEEKLNALERLVTDSKLTAMKDSLMAEITLYKAACSAIEEIENAESFSVANERIDFAQANGIKSLKANAGDKAEYEKLKEEIGECRTKGYKKTFKEIKETYLTQPLSESLSEIRSTHRMALVAADLIKEYHSISMGIKHEKNRFSFNDYMHFALEVLKDEAAADSYRNRYRYIFVDEYQDSNELQEELIRRLSRGNNVFMVGDVKQSIYRFRHAEPGIFMGRYKGYKDGSRNGNVIDLNANFRSKGHIIETVNALFDKIMDDYDEEARLNEGSSGYDESYNYMPEIHIIDEQDGGDGDVCDDDNIAPGDAGTENAKTELEAYHLAEVIKDAVSSGKLIYTGDPDNPVRPVKYKDIAILMNSTKKAADTFLDTFEAKGIPAYAERREGYFDSIEIAIMLNLLRVIDNTMQDIPLISVLFSSVFDFTSEELAMVRRGKREREASFYDAFIYAAGDDSTPVGIKCRKAYDRILEWKEQAKSMPLSDFVWLLYRETGFYIYVGALKDGNQKQTNLRMLAQKAAAYSLESSGIYGFVSEIEELKNRKHDEPPATTLGEDADAVRILTIHKSKGLEYPVVIVAGTEKRLLSINSEERSIVFSKNMGLALTYVSEDRKWKKSTLLFELIKKSNETEEIREKIRLLYVAFTRAVDWLVISGVIKDYGKNAEKWHDMMPLSPQKALECRTFLDLIMPALCNMIPVSVFSGEEISQKMNQAEERLSTDCFTALNAYSGKPVRREVAGRLSFKYPYLNDTKLKSKYSVTELNSQGEKDPITLNIPDSLTEEKKKPLNAGEKGTIYHLIMKNLDFSHIESADPDDTLKELVRSGQVTEYEASFIDTGKIRGFMKTPLSMRMAKAARRGVLYREVPFTLKTVHEGSPTIVQGIIDCFFEEDNRWILVDYKSNRIKSKDESVYDKLRETYKCQIELYTDAINRIMGISVEERYLFLLDAGEAIDI